MSTRIVRINLIHFLLGICFLLICVIIVLLLIKLNILTPSMIPFRKHETRSEYDNEVRILNSFRKSSSPAEQKAYFTELGKHAEQGDTITLQSCTPNPAILQVKKSTKAITVTNLDTTQHVLEIEGKNKFIIPPKVAYKLTPHFTEAPSIFRYKCDISDKYDGVMYVAE